MSVKYRKKPVVIEAMQFTGDNVIDIIKFTEGKGQTCENGDIRILSLEGNRRAKLNDWIIKGVAGDFYPCKPYIFKRTYEECL